MKNKNALFAVLTIFMTFLGNGVMRADTTGTKIVGGDLSLVPAYEDAGDTWLDASGNTISDLITYVKETCKWNAVRVRLFVDPSVDSDPATCQDITYVEKLGKRIKDAGMYFLLDIHYSDTWADCSKQWIPTDWSMDDATTTGYIAKKVYDYTKETLETMVAYGAAPDYVQVGNEISYGMMWDNYTDQGTGNAAWLPYSKYSTQWARFATLFRNGAKAVRKVCPNAKIILHSERTASADNSNAIYNNIISGGLDAADFDIIGLSYYPFWHGTLSQLGSTISTLQTAYPSKEIQIVETAWLNGQSSYPSSPTYAASKFSWEQTPAGQKAFINDLIGTLDDYSNVTGLYYWQPEECGNAANSSGTSQVMNSWDGRGFWALSWKSASHELISSDAIMALAKNSNFVPKTYSAVDEVEKNGFVNLDFEYGSAGGWTFDQTFSTQDVKTYDSSWMSNKCGGSYVMELWSASPASGHIISQSCTVANGKYKVTVSGRAEKGSVYLFANNTTSEITSTAGTFSVETTVTDNTLNIGIGSSSTSEIYCYFDNFTVEYEPEGTQVGAYDGTTAYLGEESTPVTLNAGDVYHYTFKNFNLGSSSNWLNWLLVGSTNSDLSNPSIVVRADNWEDEAGNNSSVTSNFDWSTFPTDMNGATVDMYVSYFNGKPKMEATIESADASKTFSYTYTYPNTLSSDNLYIGLSVNSALLDITTSETVSTVTHDGVVYTVNGANAIASGYASGEDIFISSSFTEYGTTYNVTSIADNAFKDNTTINSIHTGNNLTSVGASAFSGCTNLLYACLGTGVTSIGANAFKDCAALNILVLNNSTAITYGDTPFSGASTSTRCYLSSAEYANSSTYTGLAGSSDNICETKIEGGIVYGLWKSGLASVAGYTEDLPTQIRIPSKLHYGTDIPCTQYFMDHIEQYAFAKATNLTNVTVCNNTNQIGMCAFRYCTSLSTVTFGEDMTQFYDNVFYGDSKLKTFTFYNSSAPTQWGYNSHTPIQGLSNTTLNCPYSGASTLYEGFTTYNTLTVSSVELKDDNTTDVPISSLNEDVTTSSVTTYAAQNVTISRSMTKGNYYTLVLPWDLTSTEVSNLGITPYYLNDKGCYTEGSYLNLTFKEAVTMQGGVPYLVYCKTTQSQLDLGLEFTSDYEDLIESKKSGDAGSVTLTGLYKKYYIPTGDFFVSGTKLYYTTDNKVAMGAFRAYIDVVTSSGAKPTQIGFAVEDFDNEGIPTRIETLDAETLLPIDSKVYDITGRLLKTLPAQSGVYIVNGKKFMVK